MEAPSSIQFSKGKKEVITGLKKNNELEKSVQSILDQRESDVNTLKIAITNIVGYKDPIVEILKPRDKSVLTELASVCATANLTGMYTQIMTTSYTPKEGFCQILGNIITQKQKQLRLNLLTEEIAVLEYKYKILKELKSDINLAVKSELNIIQHRTFKINSRNQTKEKYMMELDQNDLLTLEQAMKKCPIPEKMDTKIQKLLNEFESISKEKIRLTEDIARVSLNHALPPDIELARTKLIKRKERLQALISQTGTAVIGALPEQRLQYESYSSSSFSDSVFFPI